MFGFSTPWSPKGLHCYVTGGSSGLGLCVAQELIRAGAHVSIVARGEERLASAMKALEARRMDPDQKIHSYSYSLDTAEASSNAIEAASAPFEGRSPDAYFLLAGAATPKFFVEMSEEDMRKGMDEAYWVQAWSAFAASKKMVQQGVKGRIIFCGSIVSYMSFLGYASYAPGKHALRGLAETLRSEMILYDIKIQMYFPNTMRTPGLDQENETKPAIVKVIEEADTPMTPEAAAKALLNGVRSDEFHISGDLLTSLFRSSTRGAAPYSNSFTNIIYDTIALIGVPIWRRGTDSKIRAHKTEHRAYLKDRGLLD